jgi:hypothetical protein
MKVILLVTWIVAGQSSAQASSYQVEFDSWDKCTAARDALLRDRERITKGMSMMPLGAQAPAVSAVCAAG